uniref:Uncharacterized protein n=1 Tax=Panagrolaimus davidi TaxID=227884 RepID=A0A914P2V9_9BILA
MLTGYCDYYSQESRTCSTKIVLGGKNETEDFQANLQFRILSKDFTFPPYGPINGAKLIQRNGIRLKNQNHLYTSADPCWNRTTPISNGLTARNSLCCMSMDSYNPGCLYYKSTTSSSYNDKKVVFYVIYDFSETAYSLLVNIDQAPQDSTITVLSYSQDISTQTCQASTKQPTVKCLLKLSKLNTYDIRYITNFNTNEDGIVTIIVGANSQVTSPNVSKKNRCIDFGIPGNSTEFCCGYM